MNAIKKIEFHSLILLLLFTINCNNYPESPGIYIKDKAGFIKMDSKKVLISGNMTESINGLKGSCQNEFKKVNEIIIKYPDGGDKIANVTISKLDYKENGVVTCFGEKRTVTLNYYIPSKKIDISCKKIKNQPGLYIVKPQDMIGTGYYAIHHGGLTCGNPIDLMLDDSAYDFIIGSKNAYLSYNEQVHRNCDNTMLRSNEALELFNKGYNTQKFETINSIYRPNGVQMSLQEKEMYILESKNWFNEAGIILKSVVNNKLFSEDGRNVELEINTTYEKRGDVKETFSVNTIKDSLFIVNIR